MQRTEVSTAGNLGITRATRHLRRGIRINNVVNKDSVSQDTATSEFRVGVSPRGWGRALIGLLTAVFLVVGTTVLLLAFPHLPSADDEIFYFDAGYGLATGQYSPPSANHPFHHYLRWPVILPVGVWFKLIGPGELSYWFSAVGPHVACMILVFALFRKWGGGWRASLAAAASVPFLSFHLAQPRVLSEAPVAVLSLLTLLLVERAAASRSLMSWGLAGLAQAGALSASLVALFYIPGTIFLVLMRSSRGLPWRAFPLRDIVAFGLGLIGGMVALSFLEFLVSGDFFLQLRVIQQWHLKTIAPTSSWIGGLFDPSDPERRLGGFVFKYPFLMPWLTGAIVCAAMAWMVSLNGREWRSPAFPAVGVAVLSLLALELFGPLAISKTYLRFTMFPVMLLTAGAFYAAVSGVGSSGWFHRFIWFPTVVFGLLQGYENIQILRTKPCSSPYVTPISLIQEDAARRLGPEWAVSREFDLVTLEGNLPGLAPFAPAARAYTRFQLRGSSLRFAVDPVDDAKLTYVIVPPNDALTFTAEYRARLLQYSEICDRPRPAVFLLDNARANSFRD